MTARIPRRYRAASPTGGRRRQARIRRASAGLTPTRAAAILMMLVSAGAIYGLAATPAFGYNHLDIQGTVLTPAATVEAMLGLDKGVNLVGLSTDPLEAQLRVIPSIADANVSVGLPDTLRVDVIERRPIVIWAAAGHRFVVDDGGTLFADVGDQPPAAIAALPVVTDDRLSAATLTVGVSDERGFTVSSGAKGWLAVFGFYGGSQRTPALIPGQVQLLAGLLAGREAEVATVILADDRDGTYIAKPTPHASPSSAP